MARYTVDTTPTPIDFECTDGIRRVLQNVKNLLRCRMGEVPYDRMRGVDPSIFDKGIEAVNQSLLPEIDRVLLWEPNAEAVAAAASTDENGDTVVTVTVEISG